MTLPVFITSGMLESTGLVRFAFSTRLGGVSDPPFGMNTSLHVGDLEEHVLENRRRLLAHINAAPEMLALPGQVHGKELRVVQAPGFQPGCDGLITDHPSIVLGVSAADCVPVFMLDVRRRVIAAVHAGWRGSADGIVALAVEKLRMEFRSDPADIVAYVGPSASVCCYEVGEDVASCFDKSVIQRHGEKYIVDLKAENLRQLIAAGVPGDNVEVSSHCTIGEELLFHSHRRDKGRAGRMMGVIMLPPVR